MRHRFTSLRHPLERLLEAEYFIGRMTRASSSNFQFELNAFLSAARSMTWVLQKAFVGVPLFDNWYASSQRAMAADPAMRFFLEQRNISQKEGRVSYVGGSLPNGAWTYRFVGADVPPALVGRDISACSGTHLVKLARLLRDCADSFPFHACPAAALTPEGFQQLGLRLEDIEKLLGLPAGYTDVASIPLNEKLRYLAREVEPLDRPQLDRLVAGELMFDDSPLSFPQSTGRDLTDEIASLIAAKDPSANNPRALFVKAIMKRIDES